MTTQLPADAPPVLLFDFTNPPKITIDGTLVLSFSEDVRAGHGAIVLLDQFGTFIEHVTVDASMVQGKALSYNPVATLKYGSQYTVQIDAGAIEDLAGNSAGYQQTAFFHTELSPVALNETGTDAADSFVGSDLADTYSGMGGSDVIYGHGGDDVLGGGDEPDDIYFGDRIYGGAGNDKISGGAGIDELYGDSGDDVIDGGIGKDKLFGGAGNDLLEGGAGDDELRDDGGDNILRGGEGNDQLEASGSGATVLDGGAGDDNLSGGVRDTYLGGAGRDFIFIQNTGPAGGIVRPEGGDGDDYFSFYNYGGAFSVRASGGAGRDTYALHDSMANIDLGVADFAAGDGGDVVELEGALWNTSYKGGNPFALGFVRLLQDGADTLLQVDRDGAAGAASSFATLVRLSGVTAGSLTAANFHGVDPRGSLTGMTLEGTAGTDGLSGDLMNDRIFGGGGADFLFGGGGDDLIEGGDETGAGDSIGGGAGKDLLYGGAGDDRLSGDEGNDLLDGGSGNDDLYENAGDNQLLGGEGNDVLNESSSGHSLLDGGAGNDRLYAYAGSHRLLGGEGDDFLLYTAPESQKDAHATLDGGDGDDVIRTEFWRGTTVTASGGQGADRFDIRTPGGAGGELTILDFNAQQGDTIDLTQMLGENYSGNPFGPVGRLRLVQQGDDTLLQHDSDGAAGAAAGFVTLARLANVLATSLGPTSFIGYFKPDGSSEGLTLEGDDSADKLKGTNLDDTIFGRGGNDDLTGGGGNDRLDGGDGDDRLQDSSGDNVLLGGSGKDTLGSESIGDDLLDGGDGDDILSGGQGNDTLLGGAGNDRIMVGKGNTLIASNIKVDGGDGDDQISFAAGTGTTKVTVTGGAGVDTYFFDLGSHEESVVITDFKVRTGGDKLSVGSVLPWTGWGNPFGKDGYLRLVQSGSDTLLQLDFDGAAGPGAFRTLATLLNVTASAVGTVNFSEGINPDGSNQGLWFFGTGGNDILRGGFLNDTISGLDGDDSIDGDQGNDRLYGGNGNDMLFGGWGGNDELDGGSGDDILEGGGGQGSHATLLGGDGNDTLNLSISGPGGQAEGGRGNDILTAYAMTMYGTTGWGTLNGGDGDDVISAWLYGQYGVTLSATGGAGVDTFVVGPVNSNHYTVEDFKAGAGGDLLDVKGLIGFKTPLGNVLENGVLRFEQLGLDTRVWFDRDGKAGKLFMEEGAMLLKNVNAQALTLANLLHGIVTEEDMPVIVEPPIIIDPPPVVVVVGSAMPEMVLG
jgi:Ca2+-binding RTX toxin-like protein